jgi:hypothetical protein
MGQAPVTVSASPLSQDGEVWLSCIAGGSVEPSLTPSLIPQERHLYVSGGLAGIHLASFDPHGGPLVRKGPNDFLLMSALSLTAS